MARRVLVEVAGATGLDDSGELLAELLRDTGLDWREEAVPQGRHLSGGPAEFLLVAVVSGAAGKAGEYAFQEIAERVRRVAARWSARRLDPPGVRVDVQDVADAAAPTPQAGVPGTARAQADPGVPPVPAPVDRD